MSLKNNSISPIAKRLRSARKANDLSQKRLGILAGLDEFSASPRINQYEKGKHVPDYATVSRLAKVLSIPVTYFYANNDELAELILLYDSATKKKKKEVMKCLSEF